MGVVAARMHDARILRPIVMVASLLDGERVHVGTHRYGRSVAGVEFRDDPGNTDPGAQGKSERAHSCSDDACRPGLLEPQLGIAMEVPPKLDQIRFEVAGRIEKV